MTAVRLRLCDADREKFGGPEWVTFDGDELDDQPNSVLLDFENELNTTIEFLYRVDRPAQTARWMAARVWLARKMAGVETPSYKDFEIRPRKVIVEVVAADADADPPSSSTSTELESVEA